MSRYQNNIVLTASPKQVYYVWLTPAYHGALTEGLASIEPQVNGHVRLWSGAVQGVIKELIPNKRIVQTWKTADWEPFEDPSFLILEIKEHTVGCSLSIDHDNIPERLYEQFEFAWNSFYFPRLRQFFLQS
ncbi:MAG: hypothetical protein CMK59_08075 [Proteobacteria bacterium]|nr:hypothetical protein [Pseudomonadota bacterium]|tara:strand:+ start:153 stop:545 length:393 start_codon:yes stop_codon:yes gene_type:complete